jgi:hypothetical protein
MALIVTCKDLINAIDVLHRITMAIENGKITDWEKVGSNEFQNLKKEFKGKACFRPTIKENKLYFGLINPNNSPFSVSRSMYEDFHAMFYSVLVHLSWKYYFTVEQTPDRIQNIDGKITEES